MFTVKIINYTQGEEHQGSIKIDDNTPKVMSVYLREWQSVEVWYPESQNYKDKVEQLKKETYDDYHSDLTTEEMTGDELNFLIEMHETYKAFVTYENKDGEDSFYCIAENEELYITDSNGNTVHSIR